MGHPAESLFSRVAALTPLGRLYANVSSDRNGAPFATRALTALQISVASEGALIPGDGPLVVVANHPFGALDGLVMLDLLCRVRPDVKLLGNQWLAALPELRDHLLRVDVLGGRGAVHRNGLAVREALHWLARGGCIGLFPAGEVAHAETADGHVVDSAWRSTAGELAVRAGATVLPMFFEGANSRLFRAAGRIHPLLRTALLPHELLAKRGSRVAVRIGAPIAASDLAALGDARTRIGHLRTAVDGLAARSVPRALPALPTLPAPKTPAPVAPRGDVAALLADVAALGAPLLESGAYQVFCASAPALAAVLDEIGRLREIAFRAVGEGTGRARDLDEFDRTYRHLFVWDREKLEIAGAYRLGATDDILQASGTAGLYTRTLFEYGDRLMAQLGPALELGRSFVSPTYQRDFSPLLLLWKGISRFVACNPRYRRLFGVVSISDSYESTSRQLMVKFLQTTRFDADLGRLVKAKHPPAPPRSGLEESATVERLEDVSALVRGLEPDGKDMPVLLRQYLKLNARLLGFSIDPAFGNVLDGLVVVDLDDVEPAILARYMGREQAAAFRATVPSLAVLPGGETQTRTSCGR
jgi:putative hemolysin